MNEIVLTPAALLDILQQVEELSEYPISVTETSSVIQIRIGDSVYTLPTSDAESIKVDKDVVEFVSDVNDTTYEELDNSEPVESGLLKEIAKTLLVGGMIRLTTKLLGGKK